ncbi:MAG: hypothetical protein WB493_12535 [Anaeromyxobacteraceae bacterium]
MTAPRTRQAGGYRDQVGPHPSPWEGEVPVLDVLLHDVGIGVFLVATVGALVAPATMTPLLPLAWPLSLAMVGIDMLLLLVDLGDWTRFFHMFRVFKPGTPMSLGVWSLTGFLLALTGAATWGALALVGVAPATPPAAVLGLAVLALVLAVPASIYKGAVFSITSQPGWRDARWTAGALSASSVLLGVAALAVQARILDLPATVLLWKVAPVVVLVDAALFAAWMGGARAAMVDRLPPERRVAEGLFQWGARGAALALLLLGRPNLTAAVTLSLLVAAPAYVARRTFLALPHLPRRTSRAPVAGR